MVLHRTELPRPASSTSDPLSDPPCCKGWQCPQSPEESALHRAMVGRLTLDASMRGWWSALRLVTTRSLSSWKPAWIWLVKFPGVKWPAVGVAPGQQHFSTAHWPVFLDTDTDIGRVSRAAMARAASRSFSQVVFRFMMYTPSLFLL